MPGPLQQQGAGLDDDALFRRIQALEFGAQYANIIGGAIDGQPIPQAALLPKWRRALARVVSGTGNGRILCIGDSTTVGTGSVGGGAGPGIKTASYPTLLASLLAGAGIPATAQNCFGDFGVAANAPTYDARLALGNWAISGAIHCLAGLVYNATATTASPLSFTPTISTDTCEVFYGQGTTGAFNAAIGAGGTTNVSTNGASGTGKYTITGALAANVYNLTWANAVNGQTGVFIKGFIAYNSAVKQVHVVNVGQAGAKAADFLTAFPTAASEIAAIAPDLSIIQIGINDWINATSVASFNASIQTLITGALAVGDCILAAPINSNPANTAAALQSPFTSAVAALASANGIPFVDTNYRFGGYAVGNANGLYYSDGTHASALGYADEARNLMKLLNV